MTSGPPDLTNITLADLPPLFKSVITLFLVMIGLAYSVSMVNLYLTYHLADGQPGLTSEDLRRSFYGARNETLLAAKIDGGSMEQFLPVPGHKEAILSWLQDGSTEQGFQAIEPIIQDNCLTCHAPGGLMGTRRPLDTYARVKAVTAVDRGEPIALWARVAHTHLMSLAVVFLCLGGIFAVCGVGQPVKQWVVPMPFVALVLDFGARALIKYSPGFVYVMMFAGAVMGLSMLMLTMGPLYDMWIRGQGRRAPSPAMTPQ